MALLQYHHRIVRVAQWLLDWRAEFKFQPNLLCSLSDKCSWEKSGFISSPPQIKVKQQCKLGSLTLEGNQFKKRKTMNSKQWRSQRQISSLSFTRMHDNSWIIKKESHDRLRPEKIRHKWLCGQSKCCWHRKWNQRTKFKF